MKKGEKWKTVFRIRYEHYEYNVMLFELTNASASLQTLINDTFKEFLNKFVIVYLNDILIYSQNVKQHQKHVRKILKKIQRINFLINHKKCCWNVTKVEFLEHIIITKNICINSAKIKAVLKWSTSTSVKAVQEFIELTNYYRKYIEKFSNIAAFLTNIFKKEIDFHWDDRTQKIFDEIKEKFKKEDIFASFDSKLKGIIEANVSDRGIKRVYN